MGDERDEIGVSLLQLARPGLSPDELFRLIKKAHPEASKRDIIHAAFATILAVADSDMERALLIQNFALHGRGGSD